MARQLATYYEQARLIVLTLINSLNANCTFAGNQCICGETIQSSDLTRAHLLYCLVKRPRALAYGEMRSLQMVRQLLLLL